MKLTAKLSRRSFVVSQVFILILGLAFLGGLYYILNIESQPSKGSFSLGPVTTAPKSLRLDLEQPQEDSLFFSSSIIVSGKTSPSKEILISTKDSDLVITSKPDGYFSAVIDLIEGVNIISATVFELNGDLRTVQRSVYYSKEKL